MVELPYSDGDHMRTRALPGCGRANVQADATRPCRRFKFMAAVSLSVDATVDITGMHQSQAIRCLCIGSSPDVRARGYTHGSTALLRSPSDLPEPPSAADKQVIPR